MYQIGLFLLAILAGALPVCGAAGLRAGASGGSGPLRRATAALAFSVSGGVVAAGPVPGGRPVGHPAPARGVVHRGAGSLCGAGPAHRSVRRLCPGSKRGGTGRPHRAAHPAPGGCAPARLRLFRAVVRGPDGRADAAPQHGAWHPAVSGAAERRVSYGCAAEPAFGGGAAGHVHRPAARSPAAAADRPSHACDHGVSEALRLRALLPDAGGRGWALCSRLPWAPCAPCCWKSAPAATLPPAPGRGAVCSAAPPSVCRGFRSCCRSVRSARPK